jgi:hypothetical protein
MLLEMLAVDSGGSGSDALALSRLVGGRYPPFATAHFVLGGTIQVMVPAEGLTPQGAWGHGQARTGLGLG